MLRAVRTKGLPASSGATSRALSARVPLQRTTGAQFLAAGRSYVLGQHGAKTREQRRLSKYMPVSGRTHESEHPFGYAVHAGDTGLKRGASRLARQLENRAPAYQEVAAHHREHPGTGTHGADPSRPAWAGWSSEAYRDDMRTALEEGHPGNALQLNQLGYAFNPAFRSRRADDPARRAADDSYRTMLANTDRVTIAHGTPDAPPMFHDMPLTPREKAEAYLARRTARGEFLSAKNKHGWPDKTAEDEARALFGVPASSTPVSDE